MTGTTILVMQKAWSLGCNLRDGQELKKGARLPQLRSEVVAVTAFPTPLVFFAYFLTPLGSFYGPFIEFKLFDRILRRGSISDSEISGFDRLTAMMQYYRGMALGLFAQAVGRFVTFEKICLSDGYAKLGPISQSLALTAVAASRLLNRFPGWVFTYAGLSELGLPDAGIIPRGEITNHSLFYVLRSPTVKEWFCRWNHTGHVFWEHYVVARAPEGGLRCLTNLAVFAFCLIWHGFSPFCLALLPVVFIIMKIDEKLSERFPLEAKPRFALLPISQIRWDVWGRTALVLSAMLCITSAIPFHNFDVFWKLPLSPRLLPIVIYLIIGVVLLVLPPIKRE